MSCDGNPSPLWETLKVAIAQGYGTPFLREQTSLRIAELEVTTNYPPCKIEQMKLEVILLFELGIGLSLKGLPL